MSRYENSFFIQENCEGRWFWHLTAANGRDIAKSEQGYSYEECLRAVRRIPSIVADADVSDNVFVEDLSSYDRGGDLWRRVRRRIK